MITVSQQYQKEAHRSLIMDEIRKRGKVSRAELSRITSLKRSSITYIVNELLDAGLIRETEGGSSSPVGGRRPVLLEINAEAASVIGINLEPDRAELILSDLIGEVISSGNIPYRTDPSGDFIARTVQQALQLFEKSGHGPVIAVGIGISGVVNPKQSTIIDSKLHALKDLDLKTVLHQIPVPVMIENDANCSAGNAIFHAHADPGFRNGLFVLPRIIQDSDDAPFSVELGGAVIVNGSILHGSRYITGEFSINSWFDSAVEAVDLSRDDLKHITRDEQRLSRFIETTLIRLIPAARMLDPDRIFLGGLLARRFDLTEALLESRLTDCWYDESDHAGRVIPDPYHESGIATGAGITILHQLYVMPHVGEDPSDLRISWGKVIDLITDNAPA